jgi:hypothetical protein
MTMIEQALTIVLRNRFESYPDFVMRRTALKTIKYLIYPYDPTLNSTRPWFCSSIESSDGRCAVANCDACWKEAFHEFQKDGEPSL